jgi:Flp pilus assembly pilin Flp
MLEKMRQLPFRIYIKAGSMHKKVKQAVTDFMHDEHGLSGVVVAIVLAAIAILAAVLFWEQLSDFITQLWDRIKREALGIF